MNVFLHSKPGSLAIQHKVNSPCRLLTVNTAPSHGSLLLLLSNWHTGTIYFHLFLHLKTSLVKSLHYVSVVYFWLKRIIVLTNQRVEKLNLKIYQVKLKFLSFQSFWWSCNQLTSQWKYIVTHNHVAKVCRCKSGFAERTDTTCQGSAFWHLVWPSPAESVPINRSCIHFHGNFRNKY